MEGLIFCFVFSTLLVYPEMEVLGADLCFTADVFLFFIYFCKVFPSSIGQVWRNFAR